MRELKFREFKLFTQNHTVSKESEERLLTILIYLERAKQARVVRKSKGQENRQQGKLTCREAVPRSYLHPACVHCI